MTHLPTVPLHDDGRSYTDLRMDAPWSKRMYDSCTRQANEAMPGREAPVNTLLGATSAFRAKHTSFLLLIREDKETRPSRARTAQKTQHRKAQTLTSSALSGGRVGGGGQRTVLLTARGTILLSYKKETIRSRGGDPHPHPRANKRERAPHTNADAEGNDHPLATRPYIRFAFEASPPDETPIKLATAVDFHKENTHKQANGNHGSFEVNPLLHTSRPAPASKIS